MPTQISVGLLDDEGMCLSLTGEGIAGSVVVELNANQLQQLIDDLSAVRMLVQSMHPPHEVPAEFRAVAEDPKFHVGSKANVSDQTMLTLRHPGIGWVSFLLTQSKASEIAIRLTQATPGTRH